MSEFAGEIEASSRCVRQYTNMARAHEEMADYLLGLAAVEREKAEHWQGELTRFLGMSGVTNVIQMPGQS